MKTSNKIIALKKRKEYKNEIEFKNKLLNFGLSLENKNSKVSQTSNILFSSLKSDNKSGFKFDCQNFDLLKLKKQLINRSRNA